MDKILSILIESFIIDNKTPIENEYDEIFNIDNEEKVKDFRSEFARLSKLFWVRYGEKKDKTKEKLDKLSEKIGLLDNKTIKNGWEIINGIYVPKDKIGENAKMYIIDKSMEYELRILVNRNIVILTYINYYNTIISIVFINDEIKLIENSEFTPYYLDENDEFLYLIDKSRENIYSIKNSVFIDFKLNKNLINIIDHPNDKKTYVNKQSKLYEFDGNLKIKPKTGIDVKFPDNYNVSNYCCNYFIVYIELDSISKNLWKSINDIIDNISMNIDEDENKINKFFNVIFKNYRKKINFYEVLELIDPIYMNNLDESVNIYRKSFGNILVFKEIDNLYENIYQYILFSIMSIEKYYDSFVEYVKKESSDIGFYLSRHNSKALNWKSPNYVKNVNERNSYIDSKFGRWEQYYVYSKILSLKKINTFINNFDKLHSGKKFYILYNLSNLVYMIEFLDNCLLKYIKTKNILLIKTKIIVLNKRIFYVFDCETNQLITQLEYDHDDDNIYEYDEKLYLIKFDKNIIELDNDYKLSSKIIKSKAILCDY